MHKEWEGLKNWRLVQVSTSEGITPQSKVQRVKRLEELKVDLFGPGIDI